MVLSSYKARVLEGGAGNPGSPVNLAGHPLWVFFFFFSFSDYASFSKAFISSFKNFVFTVKLCMMVFFSGATFLKLKRTQIKTVHSG